MRYLLLFFAYVCASAQTSITFAPSVITHCSSGGVGSGTVSWNYDGAGPVQVQIGDANGPTLTGPSNPRGTAATAEWVSDNMVFVLAAGSQELARTSVRVKCNPAGEVLSAALRAASYFPLQVGNEWTYTYNSRAGTSNYARLQ